MEDVILQPTEFVALVNQTLEFAYPRVTVEGELANFRISKNRWVYFDLKDADASVKCFGTVYQLPGPLEEGMLLKVSGSPKLHPQFGFSLTVQSIVPSGEGAIKKAAALLEAKLKKEGLFSPERKRLLPHPPSRIGLIASGESAAYVDFVKVLNARWQGIEIIHKDVQVQGEAAIEQVVKAIELFNTHHLHDVDVLVITRGGGSADDLAAFSTEQITRAVAASRIPTLVAIGHEVDISLAELAADQRASTPSNAAELLVPERKEQLKQLAQIKKDIRRFLELKLSTSKNEISEIKIQLKHQLATIHKSQQTALDQQRQLLEAYSPNRVLKRGFAVVHKAGRAIKSSSAVISGEQINVRVYEGEFTANVIERVK